MPSITSKDWGNSPAGPVKLYTLTNSEGNSVSILNLGGTVQSILINGTEVVIGFDKLDGYLGDQPYYGAVIGRYGNRIANAKFALNGEEFQLVPNEKGNQLHGGPKGFDKYVWNTQAQADGQTATLMLSHVSPDGDMGYPGRLRVTCTYTWTEDNELRIDYTAKSDKDTIVNLTNHTYFNLAGTGTVHDHVLEVNADRYVPVGKDGIPTGELAPVANTPFDFRTAKPVGRDIAANHPQIERANGYDHTWEISGYNGKLQEIALLRDPASGRQMRCLTSEPGVQIFTANFEPGQFSARNDNPLPTHGAICLETQHFPDSPNQKNFRTPVLRSEGDAYRTTTVYRFE